VAEALGPTLRKGESYTDWCRRPLTDAQLTYAGDDVRYLQDLAAALKRKLSGLGRTQWVREELRSLEEEESYRADPGSAWKKVSGRGSLSGRQTAVLKELARWREETAMRRDLPRGWVVKDPTLIDIARRQPRSVDELKAVRGMNAKEVQRSGREIIDAVGRGRSAPAMETSDQLPRAVVTRARVLSGLADAVVRARAEQAEMATEIVTTRGELESVLAEAIAGRLRRERHRLLCGWRRELAGDAVLALVEGRVAVKVIDEPPYVKEVEV
jgi:ribonuclease D